MVQAVRKENADKIKILQMAGLDEMLAAWDEYGTVSGMRTRSFTAGEITELNELFATYEDYIREAADMTEEEKQNEVKYWEAANKDIKAQIDQLKKWLEELRQKYLDVAAARNKALGGGGEAPPVAPGAYIPPGVGLGQIPEGTYILEKHSPATVYYIPPGVGTGTPPSYGPIPPGVGTGEAGGAYYPPGGRGGVGVSKPSPVYITAAPQVTVNITGPVQPAMIPVAARETKKAAYEGVSEALRDELRRLGKKVWVGY